MLQYSQFNSFLQTRCCGSMSCCVVVCCRESSWLCVCRMLRNEGLLHYVGGTLTELWVERHSAVGIATRYGLGGPEIESRWGWDFPHPSRPALCSTQTTIQRVPGLFLGVKWLGLGVNHLPTSSTEVKEKVELYIYSLTGPSWPVLGWTLLYGLKGKGIMTVMPAGAREF